MTTKKTKCKLYLSLLEIHDKWIEDNKELIKFEIGDNTTALMAKVSLAVLYAVEEMNK